MQLYQNTKLNLAIPNTMSREGLEFLAEIARRLPKDAVVVEAGSLYGATAWGFSKNAPSGAKVFAIDPWQHESWMDALDEKFPGCPPLSPDAFRHYTSDCDNVIPVIGYSPNALMHVNDLDLFFEDATHTNPVFSQNIQHFSTVLKPGGVLCGDDYGPMWPDIVQGVIKQSALWKTPFVVRGRVWAMIKPDPEKVGRPDIIDYLSDDRRWGVTLKTRTGRDYTSSCDGFSGTYGFKARLAGLTFFAEDLPLDWRVTINSPKGADIVIGTNEWHYLKAGEIVGLSVDCAMNGEPVQGTFQCIFLHLANKTLHYSQPKEFGKTVGKYGSDFALCDIRVNAVFPK